MPLTVRKRRLLLPVTGWAVTLDWNDNSESDLSHYNVYRSTTSGTGYVGINANNVTDSTYVDALNLLDDTTYYYVVRAVDTSGNESGNSNEVSVSTLAPVVLYRSRPAYVYY